MSADIEKLAVFDDRIVQSRPKYAVEKGALSLTNSPFNAIAANGSQHTYNILVPSENVFVDRAVEWSSTCALQFTASVPNDPTQLGQPVVIIGRDVALAAFPLHALTQTMTATINDTTTTTNTGDVLYETLRLADYKKNRSQRTCPTYLDTYKNYDAAAGSVNNPLGDFSLAVDTGSVPNGAFWNFYFTDSAGVQLVGNGTYTAGGVVVSYVDGVPITSNNGPAGAYGVSYPLYVKFRSTEKLVLSPFVFADTKEWETGLFGIQNIQLVMNMTAPSTTAVSGRVIRQTGVFGRSVSAIAYNNTNAAGTPFERSVVNVQFLTPSLDIPLPPKSVVSYMEFPRYISNQQFSPAVASGQSATNLQSQTITLPQIPDLLIIYAKPTSYAATDADYYLPITRISVNFDNFSGLLSSHTTEQLYGMAQHNGLDMDYNQWSGRGKLAKLAGTATPFGAQTANLTGGFLVLKPSQDIVLQSGQAPSLVGNFTFQFNCDVLNTSGGALSGCNLYIITANSGFFESIKGSSRIIKGVLTEQDIISAPLAPMGTRGVLQRVVGGKGVFASLGNILSKAKEFAPLVKAAAPLVKPMLPQGVQDVMGAVGLGRGGAMSGGAMTGGAVSGGRRRKLAERLM